MVFILGEFVGCDRGPKYDAFPFSQICGGKSARKSCNVVTM